MIIDNKCILMYFIIKQQKQNESFTEKLSKLEPSVKSENFKCTECKFTTDSEKGLRTHVTRKHKTATKFPRKCDLCEIELESGLKMKIHMRTHSFKSIQYKCEECDFCGDDESAMVVHNGRVHSENFECGLCNFVAKDLEALDLHLFTCEVYECCDCKNRFTNLCELKTHLVEKHKDQKTIQYILHMKQDRTNPEEYTNQVYKKEDIFSDEK